MSGSGVALQSAQAKEYERAAKALLCDCGCHPQSVKECACGRAEEMRVALATDAASGKTGDAIIAAYVSQHGQKILVSPPATGFNLIAWTGPAIGVLGAAVLIALMLKRWQRASSAVPQVAPPPLSSADDQYLARVRKEVEELR